MHLVNFFAYLDPGTGSLIIQSLIGAAAGVAVFGRRTITSVKQKLSGKKGTDTAATGKSDTSKNPSTKSDDSTKK